MIVRVYKKHLSMGQPKRNKCPLTLAFREAFGFDSKAKCDQSVIDVSRYVLTLHNYSGLNVYSIKLPPIAEKFNEMYWNHFNSAHKFAPLPKPCEFEIGVVEYYPGYRVDVLHRVIFDIKNWFGDMEYEYPN